MDFSLAQPPPEVKRAEGSRHGISLPVLAKTRPPATIGFARAGIRRATPFALVYFSWLKNQMFLT
jgi:hypothetical protein